MSLLIAWTNTERALVAVDTASEGALDKARGEASKLFTLVHLNAVIASIGDLALSHAIQRECLKRGGDFDSLSNAWRSIVDSAMHACEEHARAMGYETMPRQCAAFVGWSPALRRMRGLWAWRSERDKPFVISELDSVISPGFPGLPDGDPDSVEKVHAIAAGQVAHVRATVPECPIGGRLVLAEITRDRIVVDLRRNL